MKPASPFRLPVLVLILAAALAVVACQRDTTPPAPAVETTEQPDALPADPAMGGRSAEAAGEIVPGSPTETVHDLRQALVDGDDAAARALVSAKVAADEEGWAQGKAMLAAMLGEGELGTETIEGETAKVSLVSPESDGTTTIALVRENDAWKFDGVHIEMTMDLTGEAPPAP